MNLFFQGYDPLANEKFKPRFKKRGRSAAGAVEKRKKKVAHEDQRVFNYTQTQSFLLIKVFIF